MKFGSVLLVDDDEQTTFAVQTLLNLYDFADQYAIAANGKEAVEYISGKGIKPDLIFLDLNMPLMNGFEFLEWYEKNGYSGSSNILIYTSSFRLEDKQRAIAYRDVTEYIQKPLTGEKIQEIKDSY